MGTKLPFFRGGGRGRGGYPSNTMWSGLRPTSILSSIGLLIHPTVWPQYANVTDRHTYRQTDRQTDRETDRERSHGTGRTVLQKIAQNPIITSKQ